MTHRLSFLFALALLFATPVATASTRINHPRFTPAQRITHIQSRIHRLERREAILRTKGKTLRLQKVEMRISRLGQRLDKLHGKLGSK